ncbi:hypothetical protein DKM44_13005 [Deinococcus irradiatisoli]|uniref:Uncharacterized protein n=1 Tax=Deinococcus irradiatisoli TaxID=2202254 RepID=A0A2Z3JL94_9DEIO|nr:hypothetical protein [Deinococcus irradiatisoli]AWN24040.1 hypothetical protein DKM44_13005 [Deinococcus irradiatisoli]
MTDKMVLSAATLQAILNLQEQRLIVGDPEVEVEQEGDFGKVTLKVQMPERSFRLNKDIDLVYRTLEDTSTKTYMVIAEVTLYEPLDWEDV